MNKILAILVFGLTQICFSQNFWEPTGPYVPPTVSGLYAANDGRVYVQTWGAGFYYSTDNGSSFSYLSTTLQQTYNNSIFIDQQGNLYIIEGFNSIRSTNNGNSWAEIPDEGIETMISDPSGYIYADTRGAGIYRSTDFGLTWTQLNIKSTVDYPYSLGVNSNGDLFVSGYYSVWSSYRTLRSSDKGETWDSIAIPVNDVIKKFAFAPDNHIVAVFNSTNVFENMGIIISSNNGNSWITSNILNNSSYNPSADVIYDSVSSSFYSNLNDGIFQSTDFGNSWSIFSNIPGFDVEDFDISPLRCFFVWNSNGIKRSCDWGATWINSDSGFFAVSSNDLTLLPGGRIFIEASSSFFRLADVKMSWVQDDSALVGSFLYSKTGNYFISNGRGIFKSNDKGNTWKIVNQPGSFSFTTELTKLSNGYIFCGGSDWDGLEDVPSVSLILRSTDDGQTWIQVYSELYNSGDNFISTITTTPNDVILAGGAYNGVVRSTDSGTTWSSSTNGLPSNINCSKIRARPDGIVFMGSGSNGMFRSLDDGISWVAINNGLGSLSVTSIAMNSDGKVFVGTSRGVFESTNSGDNWTPLNSGLLDLSVTSILCDSSGYLYAATNSTGVYRSIGITTGVKEIKPNLPLTYALYQNYPNPFNPSTTINYNLPETGHVTLKVYDILGRVVATLVNEEKNAGTYSTVFYADKFASGIYFYRMQVGNFVQTKKLILLK
jgi:photosystem II stability/assembly factor-like uncharacterized protein